jgi:hypothetical protein
MFISDYRVSTVIKTYMKTMKARAKSAEKEPTTDNAQEGNVLISEEGIKTRFLGRIGKQISRHDLRKAERVPCSLLAEVDVNGEEFGGLITDISEIGCRLSITAQAAEKSFPDLKIDQTFLIRCQLPGIETPVEIAGQVKNFQREGQGIIIGTLFYDVDPVIRDYIINFAMTTKRYFEIESKEYIEYHQFQGQKQL